MLYIAAAVCLVLIGGVVFLNIQAEKRRVREGQESESEPGTEKAVHDVLLYKTDAAEITFEKSWMRSESNTEYVLGIPEDTLVTFLVKPALDRELDTVDVLDYQFHPINSFLRPVKDSGVEMRVNFVMPATDVIVNFNFRNTDTGLPADEPSSGHMETEEETENIHAEPETEPETEDTYTYGLTLHGVTADMIIAFNGMFDDREFLHQVGEQLHVDSARSTYYRVTDVTFSSEAYQGNKEPDQLYYCIYFNQNPERKLIAIYDIKSDTYTFAEVPEEKETEAAGSSASGNVPAGNQGTANGNQGSASGGNGSYSQQGTGGTSTRTVTTSFDIMSISTRFLDYVGGGDKFYQKAFEYILSQKMTGNIVGVMDSYEIDKEKETAEISIRLNSGKMLKGTYDAKKEAFSFSIGKGK